MFHSTIKQILFFLIVSAFGCVNGAASDSGAEQDFILKPQVTARSKRQSHNALKESIGRATKDVFDATLMLSKHIGSMQVNLAQLQQDQECDGKKKVTGTAETSSSYVPMYHCCGTFHITLSSLQRICADVIEQLVDGQKPFKRASRNDLEQALSTMESARETVAQVTNQCKRLQQVVGKNKDNKNSRATLRVGALSKELGQRLAAVQGVLETFNKTPCLAQA